MPTFPVVSTETMQAEKDWRRQIPLLLGLTVAFALRLYRLGDQNIWWDEGLSILAARKSFWGATLWTASDVHPPLYFWLLWLWRQAAGESWFALRFITVLEGMLTVALMAPLGRLISGRKAVGSLALWLLALSRFHIWWCQEMRMYTLAGMTAILALMLLLRWLRRPRWRWEGVALLVATTAALYTVYSHVQLLLIENLTALWAGWRRPRGARWAFWRRWIALQAGSVLLFVPWLVLALPRMRSWSVVEQPATLTFVAALYALLLTTGLSTFVSERLPLALPGVSLALGGLAYLWRYEGRRREALVLLTVGLLTPPIVIWFLTQPRSLFYTPRVESRYLLPFAPLFNVLLAWTLLILIRRRTLGLLGLTFVLGLDAAFLPDYYAGRYLRDDYLTMSCLIWAYGRPDDHVVLVSGDRYALFLPDYDAPQAPDDRPPVFLMPGDALLEEADVAATLTPLAAHGGRLWLAEVESALQDPQGLTRRWLEAHEVAALDFRFGYNRLTLFAPQAEEPAVYHPPRLAYPIDLGDTVSLVGWTLATREFCPADRVRFLLFLRSERPGQLTAELVGRDGRIVATQPLTLAARTGLVLRITDFLITPYTPPQRYHLRLRMENGASVNVGEVVVRRTGETRPSVHVERIAHPLNVRVGEVVHLLGYDLRGARGGRLRPGSIIHLTLYWESDAPIADDLHVFTHLVGTAYNPRTGGPLWAQDDQVPLEGAYPTYEWLPRIPLADEYELPLPPDLPPGDYWLTAGLYTPGGERLPVSEREAPVEERAILLARLRVEP